ncbi:MAG TPA: NADH-quinone oxidoreductase subunit L, partial [Anaeromyxobacteraceae bacterium]|nr:NADH-quinone oxidoreductase subunit L [Anaeromyxobacteraceae bacterium]
MFRSYYMTFTGEYRGGEGHHGEHAAPHAAVAAKASALSHAVHADNGAAHAFGKDDHAPAHGALPLAAGDHGHAADHAQAAGHAAPAQGDAAAHHGGPPRESPWTVTLVLALLAGGSFLTLFLGLPYAWTHAAPIFEHWLEPVMIGEVTFGHAEHWVELMFQGFGVGAATVGWLAARALYKDARSSAPGRLKARFHRAWTVLYNKYYVDELYAWLVLRPSTRVARFLARFDGAVIDGLVNLAGWLGRVAGRIDAGIDRYVVDGAVNAVSSSTLALGRSFRRIQTGRIQTYLYGALGGALLVVLLNFLIS